MEQINLNLIPGRAMPVCHVSQYDVERMIRCNLFEGDTVFALATGDTAEVHVRKPDDTVVTASLTVVNAQTYLDIKTTQQMDAVAGSNLCEIQLKRSGATLGTLNFIMEVEADPMDGGAVGSQSEIRDLQTQVDAAVAISMGEVVENLTAINPALELSFTLGKNVDSTGRISDNSYTALSNKIQCSGGDIVIRTMQAKDANNKPLIFYVSEFNASGFIKRTSLNYNGKVTIGDTTTYCYLSFGRTLSSGVTISESDIGDYFSVLFYRKALSGDEYKVDGFINRGALQDLGISSLNDCTQNGFYTFSSAWASTGSGLPPEWVGGGCVIVYNNNGTMWRKLISNVFSFTKYNNGLWFDDNNDIRVQYINEAGDDSSTEQIYIDVPKPGTTNKVRYALGHCVDNTINADVWRLLYIAKLDASEAETKITRRGEFECALHLEGRSDFSGGVVHGDEVDQKITFLANGQSVAKSNVGGYYKTFRIVRSSYLYDPNDSTTVIAEHGAEYIFGADGLTINQSIKWKVAESLTYCYLAMFPIIKAYSGSRYADTAFDVVTNPASNYSLSIPKAKSVTEFGGGTVATMSITNYPEGLTGGDRATVTDNSGINYNKIYFVICTSGTSAVDELWKSTTLYKIV